MSFSLGYMHCICKQRTSPHEVHGFVQTWNKRTGPSRLKEPFTETVEREKDIKLAFMFKSGKPIYERFFPRH